MFVLCSEVAVREADRGKALKRASECSQWGHVTGHISLVMSML